MIPQLGKGSTSADHGGVPDGSSTRSQAQSSGGKGGLFSSPPLVESRRRKVSFGVLLRGLLKVRGEWPVVALTNNLLKLHTVTR